MLPLETRLLSAGALTPEALNRARDIARRSGKPLAETLISHRFADEATVLAEWAREQGLTLVDLVETPCAADAVPRIATATYTVPTGFASLPPPGPATPVVAIAMSVWKRASAPRAISIAVS